MPIIAWVILLLVLVLAPILLTRFRKRWVAAFNLLLRTGSRAFSPPDCPASG